MDDERTDASDGEEPAHAEQEDTADGVKKRRKRRKSTPATPVILDVQKVPRFEDLGPMPTDDALAMNNWVHRSLGVSLAQVLADPEISESERRRQQNEIARTMSGLTPLSRIKQAENAVRGEAAVFASGSGPEMEKSGVAQDSVGPSSGRPAARRGRPPKRGFGRPSA